MHVFENEDYTKLYKVHKTRIDHLLAGDEYGFKERFRLGKSIFMY